MKKLRRWPLSIFVYIFLALAFYVFIVNEFVLFDTSSISIDKGEQVIFGVSVVEENPSTLLSELHVDGRTTDWATSFLSQSQSPSAQIFLDYISVLENNNPDANSEFCIKTIHLSQNDKVPLKVFSEMNSNKVPLGKSSNDSLGWLNATDEKYPNQYVFNFNENLCLKKGGKYFLPHILLGIVSSETYAKLGIINVAGYRALEFFPFEEQNILINIISSQSLSTGNGKFFRPNLEVAISQQGWVGNFYTDDNGLTNLHLSRHFFYKFILLAFSIIMAIIVVLLNNIIHEVASFFEVSFGLLLGLWGTHELLIPGYIESSTAIDVIIYFLYILVIGEISIVFFDEMVVDLKKRKVLIADIVKGGIKNECVIICNNSRIPIDMTSWILSDEAGHKFKFPLFILRGKRSVKLWTSKQDQTTLSEQKDFEHFTWGRKHSVWNNEQDTAYLEDAKGEVVHQYTYK
jgi:hypothetical protein